jgi:hypothetical protein
MSGIPSTHIPAKKIENQIKMQQKSAKSAYSAIHIPHLNKLILIQKS